MAAPDPVAEKLPSNADHDAPTTWEEGRKHLADGMWYWLATVRPDGAPHVMPVLSVWVDEAQYFVAHPSSRKAQNLAQDGRCVLTVGDESAHIVLEGEARRVTDDDALERVAGVYAKKYDWHPRPVDGRFDADYGAPTAGEPPYDVYEIIPRVVFGFGMDESFSPTRWRF